MYVATLIIQLFTCTTCNMCSTDSSNNGHQTQRDYELTDRHKCDECGASFTRKDNLIRHQLIHSSSFHKESGSESDHSTCDDSNMMSEMSGYDSGTERSGSDEKTDEDQDMTEAESEEEADVGTDKDSSGEVYQDMTEAESEEEADVGTDSSEEEYDRAYDYDSKSTMRRVLRATRRAIRIMNNQLMVADNEKDFMEHESGDSHLPPRPWNRQISRRYFPYHQLAVDNGGSIDKNNEDGDAQVTPLLVLQLLKREMRKARQGGF
ncbi:MAG: hypothetical protein E6K54_08890 [Gammaproteobacteria bacterium]|nr:MAG: hypothetical protein E6K54_08890 [Gammaproteobacteria bacterium]